jgi:hypothetical protein
MYRRSTYRSIEMDLGILAAIAMLVVWALGTFLYEAPGWLHAFLTFGVFLLIWRIVVRGKRSPRNEAP